MSIFFNRDTCPQPPKILRSTIECFTALQQLQKKNAPLKIRFHERNVNFLTYIAAIDKENASLALDEFIPNTATRLLESGEPFSVETSLDGVRTSWIQETKGIAASIDNHPCFWFRFPSEIRQYQRRATFRATTIPEATSSISIMGAALTQPIQGQLLDISATGCKARFNTAHTQLEPGQFYEQCILHLPNGSQHLSIEVRHVQSMEEKKCSQAGIRFHQPDGSTQRNIERYVYQLQREARRNE